MRTIPLADTGTAPVPSAYEHLDCIIDHTPDCLAVLALETDFDRFVDFVRSAEDQA